MMKMKKKIVEFKKEIILAALVALLWTPAFGGIDTSYSDEIKPKLIAHGGGFIEGYETTNSVEAVLKSIAEGYEIIELDLDFSRDGKLIMIHDWNRTAWSYFGVYFNGRLTESEFEKIFINGKFHTLTFDRLTGILDKAEGVRVITDVKDDNIKALTEIAVKYPDYKNRIIPQIYSYDQYITVKSLGFGDIILTLYAMPDLNYEELLNFIRNHDLFAVTVGDVHEYLIPDLKTKLAKDGVTVYYHPVYDFETAVSVMGAGVYGIYANKIVPADFEEPARSYYLLENKAKLCDLRVQEKTLAALWDVKIKNGAGKERVYLIDGKAADEALVAELPEGKHDLKLVLSLDGVLVAELDYTLLAGKSDLRILDKRYDYRLNELGAPPDMGQVFRQSGEVSFDIEFLLNRSLIVRAGENYGYCNGAAMVFRTGDELLYTQKYANGTVISPFADCIRAVGADSVTLDDERYVHVFYNGIRTTMLLDSTYINQGVWVAGMKTPLVLYRNKTLAQGDVYKKITGREYLESEDTMVLLPYGVTITSESDKEAIFKAAGLLFD